MSGKEITTEKEKAFSIEGFEGMQTGTSRFLKKKEELELGQNASYDEVGSVGKKKGYAQRADALTTTSSTSSSTSTTTTSTSTSTSTTTTTSTSTS